MRLGWQKSGGHCSDLKARIGVWLAQIGGTVEPEQPEMTAMTMMTQPESMPRRSTLSVADDPRWARIVVRDKSADGQLWYSVATTGIYCRPSCPSRTANPRNVTLHDTIESARATVPTTSASSS